MARTSTLLMDLAEALHMRQSWASRADIAREIGTSPGAAATWLDYLEFYRVIRRGATGLSVDVNRLISTMTAYRAANLRPERPTAISSSPDELHARLAEAGIPHVFAMFTAANRWAFFEPIRDIHVYLPRGSRSDLHATIEEPQARGRSASGELQVYTENLDALSTQQRDGYPVTSPLQTVLDLRAHPEGGAHAAFLEENLLPRIRGEEP